MYRLNLFILISNYLYIFYLPIKATRLYMGFHNNNNNNHIICISETPPSLFWKSFPPLFVRRFFSIQHSAMKILKALILARMCSIEI